MNALRLPRLASAILLSTAINAQVAPPAIPPATPPAPGGEIIELPAFEVSTTQDRGYQAVNSLAGGRTNIPLRLIPSAISAITAEFLDDLAITNIRQSYF